jgi:hypothetical protein
VRYSRSMIRRPLLVCAFLLATSAGVQPKEGSILEQIPPSAFSKTAPFNTAKGQLTNLTFSWGAGNFATNYEYCYDTSNDDACQSWISAGAHTSVQLKGLALNTEYYWQVRALGSGGTTYANGSATAFFQFKTELGWQSMNLNGDGFGDLFTYHPATGGYTHQLGSYIDYDMSSDNWGAGWSVSIARLNADTRTDFFLFNPTSGQWRKMIHNSSGTGFTTESTGQWWPGWQRHVLDLDGNGISDLFLYDPATGVWFRCLSTATGFTYEQGGWNPGWEIHPMRLNGDLLEDLFLFSRTTGRWFWAISHSRRFTYPATETWNPAWQLHPCDFDGDSRSDLLLHHPSTGTYFAATNIGDGFSFMQGVWTVGWTPQVADFDGDHRDDLFLYDPGTGIWSAMISDGSGKFDKLAGGTWAPERDLLPTDPNGDGLADLVVTDSSGRWNLYRNVGGGQFVSTRNEVVTPQSQFFTRAPHR